MLRPLLTGIGAASISLMATPALAQVGPDQDSEQLAFQGQVAAGCVFEAAETSFVENAVISNLSPGTADIAINQLVDEDGAPIGAVIILSLPATCNQSHSLTLASQNGGLVNPDGVEGGPFRTQLPYSMTVAWGSVSQTVSSDGPGLTLAYGDAGTGVVTLTIQIPAGGDPLVAGAYADQLILELGAAA